jgi:hypothetical protein
MKLFAGVHEPVLRVPVHLRDGAEDVRPRPLRLHGFTLQQVMMVLFSN